MSSDHMLELPKSMYALRIVQLVLATILLGLSAFNVSLFAFGASGFTVWAVRESQSSSSTIDANSA